MAKAHKGQQVRQQVRETERSAGALPVAGAGLRGVVHVVQPVPRARPQAAPCKVRARRSPQIIGRPSDVSLSPEPCYMCYMCYMVARQAAEHPLSPRSLLECSI